MLQIPRNLISFTNLSWNTPCFLSTRPLAWGLCAQINSISSSFTTLPKCVIQVPFFVSSRFTRNVVCLSTYSASGLPYFLRCSLSNSRYPSVPSASTNRAAVVLLVASSTNCRKLHLGPLPSNQSWGAPSPCSIAPNRLLLSLL